MAKRRTQLEWTELSVKALENRAKEIGLLGPDERLVYTPPVLKENKQATIELFNQWGKAPMRPFWIPTLNPTDSNRTVERVCDAAERVMHAVLMQTQFNRAVDAQE